MPDPTDKQSGGVLSLMVDTPIGDLQSIIRFGPGGARDRVWYLTCPMCERRAEIDADQFHGRVSIQCDAPCKFHETFDLHLLVDAALVNLTQEMREDRA